MSWLCEARKRFGVQILKYTVTSNHVHLLVKDGARGRGRCAVAAGDSFVLRESQEIHEGNYSPENRSIASNNGFFWDVFP
jgi:REP element-mobilizing transposase RayT